jgi:hypothetical protein
VIDPPSQKTLREADLDGIHELYLEARKLESAGKLDAKAFARLWERGLKASRGDKALLQTLAMFKP